MPGVQGLAASIGMLVALLRQVPQAVAEASDAFDDAAPADSEDTPPNRLGFGRLNLTASVSTAMREITTEVERAGSDTARVIREAGDRAAETVERRTRRATDAVGERLDELLNAASMFGEGEFASGMDGPGGGGFVTAEYAKFILDTFVKLLLYERSGDAKPFERAQTIQGRHFYENLFERIFPQFGDLSSLARKLIERMEAESGSTATRKSSSRGESTRLPARTSSPMTARKSAGTRWRSRFFSTGRLP